MADPDLTVAELTAWLRGYLAGKGADDLAFDMLNDLEERASKAEGRVKHG